MHKKSAISRKKLSFILYISIIAIFASLMLIRYMCVLQAEPPQDSRGYEDIDFIIEFIIMNICCLFGVLCAGYKVYYWFLSPLYVGVLGIGLMHFASEPMLDCYPLVNFVPACFGVALVVLIRRSNRE
jgi:phosphoglycerol transferase MdoB-like AlkP superfamily enzyme